MRREWGINGDPQNQEALRGRALEFVEAPGIEPAGETAGRDEGLMTVDPQNEQALRRRAVQFVEAPGIEERRNGANHGNPPLSAQSSEADDPEKHPRSSPDAANSAAHQHRSNEPDEDDELALFNIALAEHAERADVASLLSCGLTLEPRSDKTEHGVGSNAPTAPSPVS